MMPKRLSAALLSLTLPMLVLTGVCAGVEKQTVMVPMSDGVRRGAPCRTRLTAVAAPASL